MRCRIDNRKNQDMIARRIFIVVATVALSWWCLPVKSADAELAPLAKAISAGNPSDLGGKASELAGNSDVPIELRAKAYALLAFSYFLEGGDDAKDKCSILAGAIPDEGQCAYAAVLAEFLAGECDEAHLNEALADADKEWKAVGKLAKFLIAISNDSPPKTLIACFRAYRDALSGCEADTWASAWLNRVPTWNAWLIRGQGDPKTLEPTIASHGIKQQKHGPVVDDRKKRLQAVADVLDLYLKDDIVSAQKLAADWKIKLTGDDNAPARLALDYLAGSKSITADQLFQATGKDAALWMETCVGMFVVELANAKKLDKNTLVCYINNIQGNAKFLTNTPNLARWGQAAKKWQQWVEGGFKKMDGLEPLLAKKCILPPKDLATSTLEEFIADREKNFPNRPKLVGLRCRGAELDAHLASLPENRRKVEELRYKTIQDIKEHVIRMLERNPYPKGILVRSRRDDGKVIKRTGTIAMGNSNFLVLRKGHRRGKRYKWDDIAIPFYEQFFNFYANQRVHSNGAANVTKEEMQQNAAEEFLGIAILYDWVGEYEKAYQYAQKAIKTCPKIKRKVSAYMLR